MKIVFQCMVIVSVLAAGNLCLAAENEEIEYLLSYLAESGCVFIRNGDEHDSNKARDHLEMKYNHGKKRIKTAEKFIHKVASKSSLSQKLYLVRCGKEEAVPAKNWLMDALAAHRKMKKK